MSEAAQVDAARQLRAIKWMIGGTIAALAIAALVVVLVLVVIPNRQDADRESAKRDRCNAAMASAPLNVIVPEECRGIDGF